MEISENSFESMAQTVTSIYLTIFLDEFHPNLEEDDKAAAHYGENPGGNDLDQARVEIFHKNLEETLAQEFPNASITIARDYVEYSPRGIEISFNGESPNESDISDAHQAVAEIYEEVMQRS